MKHCATIFYGVIPSTSWVAPWDESSCDWTECIASRHKLNPPQTKFLGNEQKYEEYWKNRNELINKLGIKVEEYGCGKNLGYVFTIKDSIMYSSLEFPELIDINLFKEKGENWNSLLYKFCEVLAIKEKLIPNWYLISFAE